MKNTINTKLVIGFSAAILALAALPFISYAAVTSVTTNPASSVGSNSAVLSGSVNGSASEVWFEYGTSESSLTRISAMPVRIGDSYFDLVLTNLNPGTLYYFEAVAKDSAGLVTRGPVVQPFTTSSAQSADQGSYSQNGAPDVTTNSAYNVTSNSVSLDGYVTPNGVNTTAWFEYAGASTSCNGSGYDTVNADLGLGKAASQQYISSNGTNKVDLNYSLTNLQANTCYAYRVVAQNNSGTTNGAIMSFKTSAVETGLAYGSPVVVTNSAILVHETSAEITGTVTPNNLETSAWFELSEDSKLESGTIKIEPASIGSGSNEVPIWSIRANLTLGTTYYFRAVAQNSYGSPIYGTINSFTTKAIPVVSVPATPSTPASNSAPAQTSLPAQASSVQTVPANKLLSLDAEFNNNNPKPGKEIIYAINYENTSNSDIANAVLKVTLPNEASYKDSSFANVSQDGNVVSFKIGNVAAKSSGIVSIKIKITDLAKAESLKFNIAVSYSANGKIGNDNFESELKLNLNSLTASAIDLLGNALNNTLVDLLLGGLIGFGIYHFVIRKKQVSDTDDPLK